MEAGRDPRPGRRPARRADRAVRAAPSRRRRPSRSRRRGSRPSGPSSTFQFAAAEARTLAGEMVPLDAIRPRARASSASRSACPSASSGAISPFNFPLNLVAHKVAPAIAAGCPVVLKPASQTPFSAIALAELLLDECGLPAELAHVVTGGGGDVGNAIVDHPDVALHHLHRLARRRAGRSARGPPRKRVGLELGNNAPVIIEPDGDWRTAADKIKVAGFSHAGQCCISTQRVLRAPLDRRRLHGRAGRAGRVARRRRPARRDDRRVGADLHRRARPGQQLGRGSRSPRAPSSSPAAASSRRRPASRPSSPTPRPT